MVTPKCIWVVLAFATEFRLAIKEKCVFAKFRQSPFQYAAWQAVCESITAGAEVSPIDLNRRVFDSYALSFLRCLVAS